MYQLSILILLTICISSRAQHANNAMAYYASEHYIEAISEWEKEIKQPHANAALIYSHIGNCYFKRQDFSRAIAYYEKSLRENYIQNDVKFNLKVCRAKLGLDTENKTLFTNDWIRKLAYIIPFYVLKWFIMIFGLIALIVSITHYIAPRKHVGTIRQYLIFITILFVFLFYLQGHYRSESNYAIVAEQSIGYEHAGLKGKSKTIQEGERVEIIDEIGQTIQVKTELDALYWIDKTSIYTI